MGDYDENGLPEIVLSTWAPDNGASVNNFDDQHSYIINVELTPEPVLKWSREMGGIGSNVFLMYGDFDEREGTEFLSLSYTNAAHYNETSLELIDPINWKTKQDKTIHTVLRAPQVIYPDRDKKGHMVAIRDPGQIWRYDKNFEPDRFSAIASNYHALTALPDLNGDGNEDILIVLPDATLYLLDAELRPIATYQELTAVHQASTTIAQPVARGIDKSLGLLVFDGHTSHVLRLSENKYAGFNGTGKSLGVILFVVVALVGYFRKPISTYWKSNKTPPDNTGKRTIPPSIHKEFRDKLEGLLDEQLGDAGLTVKRVAKEMGMSDYKLRRTCIEAFGMLPKDLILHKRIKKAQDLFSTTDNNVKEVAYKVGFHTPEQFSKQFKKITNQRPSDFKKNV